MSDPCDVILRRLEELKRAPSAIATTVAKDLESEIERRFQDGRAPVLSGKLAKSVRVGVDGSRVLITSSEPYAQKHPEIVPPKEEIDGIVQGASYRLVGA